jgi:hypothetical protein
MLGRFCLSGGAAVLSLMFAGCDDAAIDDASDDAFPAIKARQLNSNTWKLNTWKLNTWKLNGTLLNTWKLNGDAGTTDFIQLYDFYLPEGGYAYDGSLIGGMLEVDGMTGQDVRYTTLDYKVKSGGTTVWKYVWIKNLAQVAPFTDVWEYDLDLSSNYGPWEKLCVDDDGNPTRALLVPDVWDTTGNKVSPRPDGAMTFACKDAAIAKCVLMGYRPWATRNGVSLADYHQACTRMVRADYCGNGTSYTQNGTPIHVLDQLGIQTLDPGADYDIEAEWGPNGATCLDTNHLRTAQALGCSRPACGAPFASGGLLQSGTLAP